MFGTKHSKINWLQKATRTRQMNRIDYKIFILKYTHTVI